MKMKLPVKLLMLLLRFIGRSDRRCWSVGEVSLSKSNPLRRVLPLHKKQLLTYLKLSEKRLGLMINFNVALIKEGITRMVNGLIE